MHGDGFNIFDSDNNHTIITWHDVHLDNKDEK